MKSMIQKLLAVSLIFSFMLLTGCNTMKGLGQDVESLGESMQKAGD
ncbi:MAG: entericidin A/B family lipoprotein [Opitutales bacterium]|nr:entericidin A/B family lipoprotein [Opitutales bacterium]MDP4693600.1 entericidin A/B family lipoprotein [Opitutales bacterium]MDP4778428.1 entericidin A/B family lipoprotein [Opitutales bacterium]MDP5080768.1 entericidin A/B family lipoprotein [Opitutales bacterium]